MLFFFVFPQKGDTALVAALGAKNKIRTAAKSYQIPKHLSYGKAVIVHRHAVEIKLCASSCEVQPHNVVLSECQIEGGGFFTASIYSFFGLQASISIVFGRTMSSV